MRHVERKLKKIVNVDSNHYTVSAQIDRQKIQKQHERCPPSCFSRLTIFGAGCRTLSLLTVHSLMYRHHMTGLIQSLSQIFVRGEIKGRYLTQPCDKSPYTNRNDKKGKWQHKNASKMFDYIVLSDRRSVGVARAAQLVGLPGLWAQPSHIPQQPCNQNYTHLKKL